MWRCLWLGVFGIIGSSLLVGGARSEEGPKGKPPLTMTVAEVAKDHLVVERAVRLPGNLRGSSFPWTPRIPRNRRPALY
jgi:hypothetical protein